MRLLDLPNWLLFIIGMFNMFATFWVFSYVCRSAAKRVIGKELYKKLSVDPKGRLRAKERGAKMEAAFEGWQSVNDVDLSSRIASTSVADRTGRPFGYVLGAMNLQVAEADILLFDFQFIGRQAACLSTQSVLVLTLPESVEVPEFYMRPLVPRNFHRFLSRYECVVEIGWPDYTLESQGLAYKTLELFEADRHRNGGELIEYIRRRNWTVEWSQGRLLVYQFDHCVSPDEISGFAAEAVTLANLIVETAEMVDAFLNSQMEATVARLEGTGSQS